MEKTRKYKYYGETDMATVHDLPMAKERLEQLGKGLEIDGLNDALEVYNSMIAFEELTPSLTCSDEEKQRYNDLVSIAKRSVGKFFGTLTEKKLLQIAPGFDVEYWEDFFVVAQKYKLLDKMSEDGLEEFLSVAEIPIWVILHSKITVEKFPELVKKLFLVRPANIEMAIDNYIDGREQRNILPNCLSETELGQMAVEYIRSEAANPKYLHLLAAPTPELAKCIELPVEVQVEAGKCSKQIIEELVKRGYGMRVSHSFAVATSRQSLLDYKTKNPDDIVLLVDKDWIEYDLNFPTLWNNLWHLYGLLYNDLISTSPSFPNLEMSTMEKMLTMNATKSYRHGDWFEVKNMLTRAQLMAFDKILQSHGLSIMHAVKWFFESYSPTEFDLKWENSVLKFPTTGEPAEKNVVLFTTEEMIRKQYSLLHKYGKVNSDILNRMSTPDVRELPSFSKDKYVYPADSSMAVGSLLLSDQSTLAYINSGEAGHSLYDLVLHGEVPVALLKGYQKPSVDFLAKKGILSIRDGVISLDNHDLIAFYKQLYELGAIGATHAPESWRGIIAKLSQQSEVRTGSSLFAEPEIDYLNYTLNNKMSQSLGLRNRYEHGIPSYKDPLQYTNDYYAILLILVLYVIKINDELAVRKNKNGGDIPYCELVPGF